MTKPQPTLDYENQAASHGIEYVIGMDEVGRGAVAGPIAVGAVIKVLPVADFPEGTADSKQLTEKRRIAIQPELMAWADAYSVGYATAQEIDQHGIMPAQRLAAHRALSEIFATPSSKYLLNMVGGVLLDGSHDWLGQFPDDLALPPLPNRLIRPKLDRDAATVAAASILAKVARDTLMVELSEQFPHYLWHSNRGYGSAKHVEAIGKHGVTDWHRKSWLIPKG